MNEASTTTQMSQQQLEATLGRVREPRWQCQSPRASDLPLTGFRRVRAATVADVQQPPSPVVLLRPLAPEEAEGLADWGGDEEFCRAAGWTVGLSRQEHVRFQQRLITEPPADLTRPGVYKDGRLVGYVALQGGESRRRELGFLIGERRLWGRGFGAAAARAGLLHGFTKMHLTEIWAEALEANVASIAILRRLGMRETGLGAQGEYSGIVSRYRQYSLAADDFHRRRP